MKITKNVPTDPGLTAAHAAYEKHGVDEFRDWAEVRGLFDDTTIRVTALAKILPGIPDTPMGRAWKNAMTQALALAEADAYRAYDDVDLDDNEMASLTLLTEMSGMIAATSTLLAPVAVAVRGHGSTTSYRTLGDLVEKRAEVDERGVVITLSADDCAQSMSHQTLTSMIEDQWDMDDDSPKPVIAPWAHIEAIEPGLRFALTRILDALRAHMPVVEPEEDPGMSRTPMEYALSTRWSPTPRRGTI